MKIVEFFEESGLLIKSATETTENKENIKKRGFTGLLLGTLGASLLINMLIRKGVTRAEGTINQSGAGALMQPYPLTNFEIQGYYQNEPKFNDVYSRNNLPKIKDGTYVINLDECKSVGTHWDPIYVKNEVETNFDSFGIDYLAKEIKKFTRKKNY